MPIGKIIKRLWARRARRWSSSAHWRSKFSAPLTATLAGRLLRIRGVRDNCVTVFGAYVDTTGMFRPGGSSYGPRVMRNNLVYLHLVLSTTSLLGELDNTASLIISRRSKTKSPKPKTRLSYPWNTWPNLNANVNPKNIISSLEAQYTGRTIQVFRVINTQPP